MRQPQNYPRIFFLLFSLIVIVFYLYQWPSWGVVDDWGHHDLTMKIWDSPHVLKGIFKFIKADFFAQKIRPIHCLYTVLFFKIFSTQPIWIYIINFLIGMAVFPLWGKIFVMMFCDDRKGEQDDIYIYPLSFFAFLPFWNNFMYITIQEKFIFYFSPFVIYFFLKLYETKNIRYLLYVFIFAVLCILSKPTGIFIILMLLSFALLSLLLSRQNTKYLMITLAAGSVILAGYYAVVKLATMSAGYSSKYGENLNFAGIWQNLSHASMAIQGLVAIACIFLILFIILSKRKKASPLSLLLPLGFLCYIAILLPWGVLNYHLGPVAPFLMGLFFPGYLLAKKLLDKVRIKNAAPIAVCGLVILVLTQVIYVRIVKMADIRRTVEKIIELNTQGRAKFYFPPPYIETHFSLERFTHARIQYLDKGMLDADEIEPGENYFLSFDQSPRIILRGLEFKELVYQNRTWRIYKLGPSYRAQTTAYEIFPKTFLEKLVEKTR